MTIPSATEHGSTLSQYPNVAGISPTESSLMMNPPMAEDIAVLQQYLTSHTTEGNPAAKLYKTISNAPGNPIIYLTVPKRRKGLNTASDPGRTQREIIEQILNPFAAEVRRLYFDRLHPCFPILDEKTFTSMWKRDNEQISSTLLCDLYASALSFWECSELLQSYPRPDVHFIWNQAVAALQDDFMAPTISTVHAALLDMVGRPVIQVTGNIVNAGRIATLAQSLGLHRDPTLWKATPHEKSVRVKLWWAVVIHDYWSSLGHGIPPTTNPRYYDVPIPTSDMLATSLASETQKRATTTFIYLCKLSQILGDVLPFVYSLQLEEEEVSRSLRRTECVLDDWAIALPGYLRPDSSPYSAVNGASNLWFSYLSVKVLICRLAFKTTLKCSKPSFSEARQYRLALLREASCDVVDFVTSLNEAQLREFWMPYTSYLLVTATTILLRCTIECGAIETKRVCATKLLLFIDRLRRASEISGWDLADFCLERCHEPIQKIADALKIPSRSSQTQSREADLMSASSEVVDQPGVDTAASGSAPMPDFFLPIDSLDYPWETLWDTFEGPWPIQI
ncbi:Nn.00g116650.m01.CDS01 [Neocucurbitaria sp. VM-36]